MTTSTATSLDQERLREALESIIRDASGRDARIAAIQRRQSEYASYYACEIITVRLAGGGEMAIFLKDFGRYQSAKEGMEARRERERQVYEELLAEADLGTARFYGSVWEAAQGRFWLFLEFVPGTPVRYCSFEHWVSAAAWLARLHAHFSRQVDRLEACSFLHRHDTGFFQETAERAHASVSQVAPPLAHRLVPILRQYDRTAEDLARLPPTLVHGAYRPGQILLDTRSEPPRVCPVDWELAACGSGLYDLAFLADGFKSPRLEQILEAYRREAGARGLDVAAPERLARLIDAFRLHKALNWLSHARERGYSESDIAKIMGLAEQVASPFLCTQVPLSA